MQDSPRTIDSSNSSPSPQVGIFGVISHELIALPNSATQFSPLLPGSASLEEMPAESLDAMLLLAPPGTVERRYVTALALQSLKSGGTLTMLAPKDKGGARMADELRRFGCNPAAESRRHHRFCTCRRPPVLTNIEHALSEGAPRLLENPGWWTQPGIFSWDRLDPGSALLLDHMPAFSGRGADFGCGIGVLSRLVLASPGVTRLALIDIDRRAVDAARRNIDDPRAEFHWADMRAALPILPRLDFVVMNPPFHDGGIEDRSLGISFIRRASEALRSGGRCWLTANRHLPYESELSALFSSVRSIAEDKGYKILEAIR